MAFPNDFVWGAAAASYQIEGATREDGKGPSVWDMFVKKPNAIWRGHDGEVACDHYHRYAEDVQLMKSIGLQAYRLSLCWPRILPDGTGAVNEKGLSFYDRLIDELLAAGIEPFVTLFHWDYPLALYRRGGWLNRDSTDWFAAYTEIVVRRLGDRVKNWMTLNEPQCFVLLGHQTAVHAPGDKLELSEVLGITHHALLAHGKGVQAIRAASPGPCRVGFAPVAQVMIPATESPLDIAAARQRMFSVDRDNHWQNALWTEPVLKAEYSAELIAAYGEHFPRVPTDDLRIIAEPLDFFGTNIYFGEVVRAGEDGRPEVVPPHLGFPISAFNWPITPDALYWGPKFLHERYKLPILITENGTSCRDWVMADGKVHDPARIDFITRYLRSFHRAVEEGVPALGYLHWSIMDNFEWAEGYRERFGMIHVDYTTQKRTLKDSAHFYAKVIATNGAHLLG
jgi:beta-glucosidase